jgi:hypothetical protein
MAYLVEKGYCPKCKRIAPHRYSFLIKCLGCGAILTLREFIEGNEAKQNQ